MVWQRGHSHAPPPKGRYIAGESIFGSLMFSIFGSLDKIEYSHPQIDHGESGNVLGLSFGRGKSPSKKKQANFRKINSRFSHINSFWKLMLSTFIIKIPNINLPQIIRRPFFAYRCFLPKTQSYPHTSRLSAVNLRVGGVLFWKMYAFCFFYLALGAGKKGCNVKHVSFSNKQKKMETKNLYDDFTLWCVEATLWGVKKYEIFQNYAKIMRWGCFEGEKSIL